VPESPPPFNKWRHLENEEPQNANPPSPGPHQETSQQTDNVESTRRLRLKMWLLRSAWAISTGMLILGGLLMILILAGQGHRIGL
jgi:hypothetical protein